MNVFGFFKSAFSEDNGNPSSMRIITLLIVSVVLFNWTFYNIQNNVLTVLDYNQLLAILGPLGFKALQKNSERKKETQ